MNFTKGCVKQNQMVQLNQAIYYHIVCLMKSANLSSNHEELIKATIPELKYDLMKDQLKTTFSDASRNIPTKNEKAIKAENIFLTEHFGEMTIEEGFNSNQEYNPFRSKNSQ